MRLLLLLVCVAISLNACHNKNDVPKGILQKNQMQSVLWDIMQAEAFTNSFIRKNPAKKPMEEDAALQKQIFALHNISKEDFDKSYDYYLHHSDIMLALLDSMATQETRAQREELTKKNAAILDRLKIKQLRDKNLLLQKKANPQDSIKSKFFWNKHPQVKPKPGSIKQSSGI